MNKLELIQALNDTTNLSKSEAARAVDIFFNEMAEALAKRERVEIRGFEVAQIAESIAISLGLNTFATLAIGFTSWDQESTHYELIETRNY